MPQASPELRAKFPGHDAEALEVLAENFKISRGGVFSKINPNYDPTDREFDALDYMIAEWDYAYEDNAIYDSGDGIDPLYE